MTKNTVAKISNSFSTGGGGFNFERNIQAMFLLTLLIKGFCPVINEPTKKVCFQAKRLGYDVDDIVIFTHRGQSEGKILCQIKHSIRINKKNRTLQEVINASWIDFNKENFDKQKDKIVLAVAQIDFKYQHSLKFLYNQAKTSISEKDFFNKVNLPNYSSDSNRKVLNSIRYCISKANGNKYPTDFELWEFCKVFVLMLFDLDYTDESINRVLIINLIKSNCNIDPFLVWSRLLEYSSYCDQNSAYIDIDSFDSEIKDFFYHKQVVLVQPPKLISPVDRFLPIVSLIGSWRENNYFDRTVIEKISGYKYEEFENIARSLLINNPDYFKLNNGVWKVIHKKELLEQFSKLFFDDLIERLFDSANKIYKQENKSLENKISYYIQSTDIYDNSLELRNSLLESMCLIKCNFSLFSNCNKEKLNTLTILFVRDILHDCECKRWLSLNKYLRYIVELEPYTFLKELESNIINNPKEILKLFPKQSSDYFMQDNNISELLWSLEVLAWSPDYMVSSIRCLGLLEALDYEKTNWNNTPINSIISILLPRYPQTLADYNTQKNALIGLQKDSSEVFWNVIIKLLPERVNSVMCNPKPRFMPIVIPDNISVNNKDMCNQYSMIMNLAVDFSKDKENRLAELVKTIAYMSETTLSRFLDYINKIDFSNSEEKIFNIWLNLCNYLNKNTSSKVFRKQNERIKKIIRKIEPKDIKIKYKKLYLSKYVCSDKNDFLSDWDKLEKNKIKAIHQIFTKYGFKAVEAFGYSVNNLNDVGFKLGLKTSQKNVSLAIKNYYENTLDKIFFASFLCGFCKAQGAKSLLKTTLKKYNPIFISDVLSLVPFYDDLIPVVTKLLTKDDLYWEKASIAYTYQDSEIETLQLIVKKLLNSRRFITAINVIGHSNYKKAIAIKDLYNLLWQAGTEESIGNENLDIYSAQKLIGWLQEQKEIDIESLSNIEFIYLPILDRYSRVRTKALDTRLSLDADYFCNMIERYYKKHSETKSSQKLNQEIAERLFKILHHYKIVPGTDWNGNFDEKKFKNWMNKVTDWSKINDRYEITMQTVGSGLSYSSKNEDSLSPEVIIQELNKPENENLRIGYKIGIINQRGVYTVDPEGKPEFELSKKYADLAKKAEKMGYSRYSDVLRSISENYKQEAIENIHRFKNDL